MIRKLNEVRVSANHRLRFATFDVTALYPSIVLERGLNSTTWFLNTFCFEFQPEVTQLVLVLARCFALTPISLVQKSAPVHFCNGLQLPWARPLRWLMPISPSFLWKQTVLTASMPASVFIPVLSTTEFVCGMRLMTTFEYFHSIFHRRIFTGVH